MQADLADYLASVARRPFDPGALDCSIFMADWIFRVTGIDPIADKRGAYSTDEEYRHLLKAEGGFVDACHARALSAGLRQTTCPKLGDPVLVNAPIAIRQGKIVRFPTGSICASESMRAVLSRDRGLVIAGEEALPIVKAWTF